MNVLPHESFAEISGTVLDGLMRRGFHFLSSDELCRLWEPGSRPDAKLKQLRALAAACGAKFEADAKFSTARFIASKKTGQRKPHKASSFLGHGRLVRCRGRN